MSSKGFAQLDLPSRSRELISHITKDAKIELTARLMSTSLDLPLIRSLLSSITSTVGKAEGIYTHNELPLAIIMKTSSNSFVVLAQNEHDCKQIVSKVEKSFIEFSKVTSKFGYKLDNFVTGKDVVTGWLRANSDVKSLREQKPANEFEKEVIKNVRRITSSLVSNVEIVFKKPPESTEYDVVSVLSNDHVFVLEAMDYQIVQDDILKLKQTTKTFKENFKSVVVLRTIDKALRLSPRVSVVVFLRGFPGGIFSQIQRIGESRGLLLLSDEDLENKIDAVLSYGVATLRQEHQLGFNDYLKDYQSFSKSMRKISRDRTIR